MTSALDPADVDPGAAEPAVVTDGPAAAAMLAPRVAASTGRLLATAAAITDTQAREPSRLPGWSRGHLLTHLARNADSLVNLLTWARTGVVTPQYASAAAREEGIADGAGRPAADLIADLTSTAAVLAATAAQLTADQWDYEVAGLNFSHPAWFTLWRRLAEVEIHHVDLGCGYTPADWPADFAVQCLAMAATDFAEDTEAPAVQLVSTDDARRYQLGPPGRGTTGPQLSGGCRDLLAWVTGRSDGSVLISAPPGPLPVLPSW